MQVSAEGIALGTALTPGLIYAGSLPGENEWLVEGLRAAAEAYGASEYYLVAIDREGTAHPLAGTLSRRSIGPQVLESLESPHLWKAVDSRLCYTFAQLRMHVPAWPVECRLGGRFLKDGQAPLGSLLLAAGPARPASGPGGAPKKGGRAQRSPPAHPEGDLLGWILRHWRATHEARALRGFARALVGAQPGGVLAIDVQGRVTYLSPLGEEILGVDAGEAVGADCARVMRLSVEMEHPLLRGLEGKLERMDLYVTHRRGRDVPVTLRLKRIMDPEGDVRGLVCLFQDLTEERALDEDVRRRERLAVIGALAAGAAHEIRNPLTGIGNCAQVLQMRLADQDGNRKMADLILREARRLDGIITSLLSFARPGPPNMREVRIEECVRSVLELEQPVCEKGAVRCEMRVAGTIPPVYADPEQIQQVIANLIRNSVGAMPDGGVLTLEVSVVRRRLHVRRRMGRRMTDRVHIPSEGPMSRFVRIRVMDTGKGIAREILPRIFDPFFTTRSEGTGLGLSVSQSIVQEHGGFISVQSVRGKRTVFDVDLPMERRQGERRE